jgi:hypothetical protein
MNIRAFVTLLLLWCFNLNANAENKEFETFAQEQSQLMHKAYEKKDTKTYDQLLTAFMSRYEKAHSTRQEILFRLFKQRLLQLKLHLCIAWSKKGSRCIS